MTEHRAFEDADLRGSAFTRVDLRDSTFRAVDFSGSRLRGVELVGVDITGWIHDLTINGVDVVPLIAAELDRRDPDRVKMRPTTRAGFAEAWDLLDRLWAQTVNLARTLPPDSLHERVDGEWSFVETLRHLLFATDAWVQRAVLGRPSPWHPLDLPHDEMPDLPGVPRDVTARPSLEEVLALRLDRITVVRDLIAGLDDAALASMTVAVPGPGYPESRSYPVAECLRIVLNEEWEHRRYAERDLAVLAAR